MAASPCYYWSMKLWTTVDVTEIPGLLQNGFTNPYCAEIVFEDDPEFAAENAYEMRDEGSIFLEVEFPDEDLEVYFAECVGISGDRAREAIDDIESDIEIGVITDPLDLEAAYEHIEALQNIDSAQANLTLMGFCCLRCGEVFPQDLIKILDPETMQEAMWTGDVKVVGEAAKRAEATPITELGASFWVWLLFVFQNVFAAARGEIDVEPAWKTAAAEEKAQERKARRARVRKGRPRKKKKRKVNA